MFMRHGATGATVFQNSTVISILENAGCHAAMLPPCRKMQDARQHCSRHIGKCRMTGSFEAAILENMFNSPVLSSAAEIKGSRFLTPLFFNQLTCLLFTWTRIGCVKIRSTPAQMRDGWQTVLRIRICRFRIVFVDSNPRKIQFRIWIRYENGYRYPFSLKIYNFLIRIFIRGKFGYRTNDMLDSASLQMNETLTFKSYRRNGRLCEVYG